MSVLNAYESQVELAVDVFRSRTPQLINSLKDFLTFLPNTKCVEEVLSAAFYYLAETDPDSCLWLLNNPEQLKPELNIVELAAKLVHKRLESQGFILDQDFWFESGGRLYLHEKIDPELIVGNSTGNRIFLERLLQICH